MTTSTASLVPALTSLDERVLAATLDRLPDGRAPTTDDVVRRLHPVSWRSSGATAAQAREIAEILRGLEHTRHAHERDGRWYPGPRSGNPDERRSTA